MAVTMKDVEHVAKLAHLKFSEEEKAALLHDLNEILSYMEKLKEVDTSSVEPLSHVNPVGNVFREDIVIPSSDRETILKNAPDRTEEFFKVPKVIGDK
ncbi:MAG TPA: Asp-tRNA(Asn)/Glu-tRNA(Gln) amidotransferase subunit GatC [Bacteroidota bacterium]|nr:Asp-tRNA(Asn)/Glu-tRNA(Gln) amidotransferase subunit GatC [Bacteroidota bacterium]